MNDSQVEHQILQAMEWYQRGVPDGWKEMKLNSEIKFNEMKEKVCANLTI